jgi:hypothetical protein
MWNAGCCIATGRFYDTAHAVFRPRHMSPEELEHGYGWMYQRLFSHASLWQRRPEDWRALAPYLLMSYLYKRSNRFWHFLIWNDLVHTVWQPLILRHTLAPLAISEGAGTIRFTSRRRNGGDGRSIAAGSAWRRCSGEIAGFSCRGSVSVNRTFAFDTNSALPKIAG